MIEIGGYKIHKCDEHNWCIEKKRTIKEGKHKGDDVWGGRKYYPTIESACLSLFDILVSGADANSVSDLVTAIYKAKEDIIAAVAVK